MAPQSPPVAPLAPHELVRRVERPDDLFELGVVRVEDDVRRIEGEPLPPARLEPVWILRTDQHEYAVGRSHPLELEHHPGIGLNAGATYRQLRPTIFDRERLRESSAYVGARASRDEDASQPCGRFYANELICSRAQVNGEPAAACGHLENPPPFDLELGENTRMNRLGLADGVPELRLELVNHRPEKGSTEPLGRLSIAALGRFSFGDGDGCEVLVWQPRDIFEGVSPPARRSGGSGLEVIHLYIV